MSPTFGENLKAIRENNGWTLEEMAEKLGSTKQVLSRYERGERTPKITMASHFADALGVPLRELVGFDADPDKYESFEAEYVRMINEMRQNEISKQPQTKEARIISAGIDKMEPERREQALKVLQTIFADIFDGGNK